MIQKLQYSRNSSSSETAVELLSGSLTAVLVSLQEELASGIVWVKAPSGDTVSQHAIILRQGAIVYAGKGIPTPREFVTELARHVHVGVLDTVLDFAAKRSSIQGVMRAMVDIGVLKWPEIIAAARKHTGLVLKELKSLDGAMTFERGFSTFDLQYGEGEARLAVDALLLEGELDAEGKSSGVLTIKKETAAKPQTAPASERPRAATAPKAADARASDLEHSAAVSGRASARPEGARAVILSVDDSPIARALVERTLEPEYETISCGCVTEALNILDEREDISMLLLDLTLPDIDGLSFCRVLRGIEKYKGLPIIMLTARDGVVNRVRGRIAGTTHYLAKPFSPTELLDVMAQYVA